MHHPHVLYIPTSRPDSAGATCIVRSKLDGTPVGTNGCARMGPPAQVGYGLRGWLVRACDPATRCDVTEVVLRVEGEGMERWIGEEKRVVMQGA